MKQVFIFLLIFVSFVLYSCDKSRVYEKNIRIPDAAWDINNKLEFETEISDISVNYNFYINTRNTTDYEYSNIYFFVNTSFPSGEIAHDTLEYFLADYTGKWLGKGIGKIKESHILFKPRFRFPQEGIYSFEVRQAMRVDTLTGISDVGIRIEKTEK